MTAPEPGRETEPTGASPVLVGPLLAGRAGGDAAIAWTLWPCEVYRAGAVVRLRLTPLAPWTEYPSLRDLVETLTPPGRHHRQIVLRGPAGPLRWVTSQLPTPSAEPGPHGEPWDHSWTVEWWWPRGEWRAPLQLVWPERDVEIELPIDPTELETVAALRPAPPSVAAEDHAAGLDVPNIGADIGAPADKPMIGRTRRWPHAEDDT